MNERISIADKNPEVKSYNHIPQIRRKTESFQSKNSPVDRILFLQRIIGNQAVGKLINSGAFGYTPEVTQQIEANVNALRDNGQPLSESTRAFFEPRFGHNFSHVRVHTDAKASESAKEMNAQAYTIGQDVVFGAGQYTPSTTDGPPGFNQNLGCARALKAQSALITPDPGIGFAGIAPTRITGIINHGPVPGPVADRRSVVIRTTASAPTPPAPVPPTPSAPTCVPRTGITEYGCYCGRGRSCPAGHTCPPIDALDACCQAHDIWYTACNCEFEDSINPFSSRNAAARACDLTLCRCARGLTLTGRAATYRDRMLRVFRC